MEGNNNELYDIFQNCLRDKTLIPYWLNSRKSLISSKISIINSYESEQESRTNWMAESYEESERKLFYLYKKNSEGQNVFDIENEKLFTRRAFSLKNIAETYELKSMELNPDFFLLEIGYSPQETLVIRVHQLTHIRFSKGSFNVQSRQQSVVVIYSLSDCPKIYYEGYQKNGKKSFMPLSAKIPILPLSIRPIEEALSSRFPIYKDVLRESPKYVPVALHDLLLFPTKKNFFENYYKKSLGYVPSNKLSLDKNYILRYIKPWLSPEDFMKIEMYFKQHSHASFDYSKRKYKLDTIKEICFSYLLSKDSLIHERLTQAQIDELFDLFSDLIVMSLDYQPRPRQQIRLPNSFSQMKKLHDRLAKEERLRLRKQQQEELNFTFPIRKKFKKLADSLETMSQFYLFKKGMELVDEGEVMGNCIGGYVWKQKKGDCFVCRYTDDDEHIDLEFLVNRSKTEKAKYILVQAYRKYNRSLEPNQKKRLQNILESFKTINIDTSILSV